MRQLNGFRFVAPVKTTAYFDVVRHRSDRAVIEDGWIERIVASPEHEAIQADGRVRMWGRVEAFGDRYLRVILLPDRETVHNAFFDRRFSP